MSTDQPTLAQIAQRLFDDALHNIIHDVVLTRHREHKVTLASLDPTDKLPHCEICKLPRLLDPPLAPKVRGATADPPASTQYCERKPWSRRAGHDIYDNPFPRSDVTGRPPTKKEREAAKNNSGKKDENTPASEDATQNGTAPPSPSAGDGNNNEAGAGDKANSKPLEKGEKKASKIDEKLKKGEYVPWHTCPSCKRSLLITRFAKHLEQCMGLSGRAASRNAMARMGNGSTPGGSRGGTPNPSQSQLDNGVGAADDDEDDAVSVKDTGGGGVRKKLLKKGLDKKIKKMGEKGAGGGGSGAGATNGKLPKVSGANKKTPAGGASRASPAPSSSGAAGEGKRDREREDAGDEDDGDVHVKKRQKLTRVGSTASMASSSALGHELERTESQDGSFVDEGSVGGDD